MVKNTFYVLVVTVLLLFSVSSVADQNTGILCEVTGELPYYNCQILSENGEQFYCDSESGYCFLEQEEVVAEPVAENVSAAVTNVSTAESDLQTLGEALTVLQADLTAASKDIGTLNKEITSIKSELLSIESGVASLKTDLSQQLSSVENQQTSLSVGLAGLQQDIDSTKETLNTVEESLEKRQAFTRFMSITIFILVILAAAGAVIYYVTTKGKKPAARTEISPEVVSYITKHIKRGSKFPQIKAELLKAGWSDGEVEWAYKETAKQNYYLFKGSAPSLSLPSQKTGRPKTGPSPAYDPKKIIGITVVVLLLLGGSLLILRGVSTGQAIFFQRLVGGEAEGTAGKITYAVDCPPPHIVTPDGDACCLDENQNGLCDSTEARQVGAAEGACTDNAQCSKGEYCIGGGCTSLASVYQGTGDCSKQCNFYALKISTSDGETYDIKPRTGSYTAAGALEWKILDMPTHCKGEPAIIPVNIIKKKTGQIISETAILLKKGQASQVQTHPEIPSIGFTLKVDEVFELCSQ